MTLLAESLITTEEKEAEQILGASTMNLAKIFGHKSFDEMLHRDYLVLLTGFDSLEKGKLK